MFRNILTVLVCFVCVIAGVTVSSLFAPTPPPTEQSGITTGVAEEVMRLVSLRIPATVYVARGQVVAADGIGKKIEEIFLGEDKKQVILFVKGQLDFGIDFDKGFEVLTDDQRKEATFNVPSPRFLQISDQDIEVGFTWGPITADDINAAKNKAILKMRSEGRSPRHISHAKAICARQLQMLATAFGYSAKVNWLDHPVAPDPSGKLLENAPDGAQLQ